MVWYGIEGYGIIGQGRAGYAVSPMPPVTAPITVTTWTHCQSNTGHKPITKVTDTSSLLGHPLESMVSVQNKVKPLMKRELTNKNEFFQKKCVQRCVGVLWKF